MSWYAVGRPWDAMDGTMVTPTAYRGNVTLCRSLEAKHTVKQVHLDGT